VPPAVLWGDEATVRERLRNGTQDLQLTRRIYPSWHYPFGVPQVVEFFRQNYGPMTRAFATLDSNPEGQKALRRDLEQVVAAHNRATDSTTLMESEYLDVIATRS